MKLSTQRHESKKTRETGSRSTSSLIKTNITWSLRQRKIAFVCWFSILIFFFQASRHQFMYSCGKPYHQSRAPGFNYCKLHQSHVAWSIHHTVCSSGNRFQILQKFPSAHFVFREEKNLSRIYGAICGSRMTPRNLWVNIQPLSNYLHKLPLNPNTEGLLWPGLAGLSRRHFLISWRLDEQILVA